MTAKFQPTGTKDVKINLAGAYRTTLTHLVAGDVIRLDRRQDGLANGALIPTPTHSPKRSFWATVTEVVRGNRGQIQVTTDQGPMPWDFSHTSVTRKERKAETAQRLAIDSAARQEALADSEREVAAGHIQDMAAEHAMEDAARQLEEERIQDALAAHPAVRFPEGTPEHAAYTAELKVELAKFTAGEAPYQADPFTPEALPERAALGEPMCLGDFGAYGQCIAVPGHPGQCMDAFGHRFDGRNRAAALPTTVEITHRPAASTEVHPLEIRPLSVQEADTHVKRGVQVWHPDYTGTVWVVTARDTWTMPSGDTRDFCDLVVPGTGDTLTGVPAETLVPVTMANMAAYVATLGPRGGGAALALVAVQDRLRKGTQAAAKVNDARRVLADKLAGAKEQRRAMNTRFLSLDRVAQAANDARIEALEEALSLLA